MRAGGGRRPPSRPGSGGRAALLRCLLLPAAFLKGGDAEPCTDQLPTSCVPHLTLKAMRWPAGAASVISGMESYGHKRQHSGERGGPQHKRGRGSFGGRAGNVLPPPGQRSGGRGGGSAPADLAAADYSD